MIKFPLNVKFHVVETEGVNFEDEIPPSPGEGAILKEIYWLCEEDEAPFAIAWEKGRHYFSEEELTVLMGADVASEYIALLKIEVAKKLYEDAMKMEEEGYVK